MTGDVAAGSLDFKEAIDHFRAKVKMPTKRWSDMLEGQHTRAFTVAGATKDAILTDFHSAIDKAISQGTTLEEFRQDFDKIVETHGWSYNGSRGWRTKVIYETNLRTAQAAGRYKQLTDPDVLRYQPYWRYIHDDSVVHARAEHKAWDGLTLLAVDPWWSTHTPANGWGCKCRWEGVTKRGLKVLGKSGPDQAPPVNASMKTLFTSFGPVEISVPEGIDPGWGYSVGETAYGKRLCDAEFVAWQQNADKWEPLTKGDWQSMGRPEEVPKDPHPVTPGPKFRTPADMLRAVTDMLGGSDAALPTADGGTVYIQANSFADHLMKDPGRSVFLPLVPDLLANPYEVWATFERHRGTGQVILRKRYIMAVEGHPEGMVMVADAAAGKFGGWTFYTREKAMKLNKLRSGRLLWFRG
jgi:hypothetical protein